MKNKHRINISLAQMGMKFTEEHKQNISLANKGRRLGYRHSEETKAKISKSMKQIRRQRKEEGWLITTK
jgi:hypothetical protein